MQNIQKRGRGAKHTQGNMSLQISDLRVNRRPPYPKIIGSNINREFTTFALSRLRVNNMTMTYSFGYFPVRRAFTLRCKRLNKKSKPVGRVVARITINPQSAVVMHLPLKILVLSCRRVFGRDAHFLFIFILSLIISCTHTTSSRVRSTRC